MLKLAAVQPPPETAASVFNGDRCAVYREEVLFALAFIVGTIIEVLIALKLVN